VPLRTATADAAAVVAMILRQQVCSTATRVQNASLPNPLSSDQGKSELEKSERLTSTLTAETRARFNAESCRHFIFAETGALDRDGMRYARHAGSDL